MGWPTLVLILSSLGLVACYHLPDYELLPPIQKHIPPSDVPSFQRTSVEGLPQTLNNVNNHLEFGSSSLPLRDAVESSPRIVDMFQALQDGLEVDSELLNKRTLLRDAVERRPPPPLGNNVVDHESIWLEQLSPPAIRKNQGPPKIICRYNPESLYRKEPFALDPQNIPRRKCTHLIYSAATFDPRYWTIISRNPERDELKGGYKIVTNLRKKDPSLQILVSINSLGHGKYLKELINNPKHVEKFVESTVSFLKEHQFDGIELNWKHPNIPQLKLLLQFMYPTLYSKGYTLAVVLRPENMIDARLSNLADILLLQPWQAIPAQYAAHPAPLDSIMVFIKKWIDAGASFEKIVLGLPFFGKSYTLKNPNATFAGSPIVGPGIGGPYTKGVGVLAYYEICDESQNLWNTGRDYQGPFMKRGDQWIGFEDPFSIKIKTAYAKTMNLGGVLLSSIDLDDFVGVCGNPWPMLDAAITGLGVYNSPVEKCEMEGIFKDPENCAGFFVCDKGNLYQGVCNKKYFFSSVEKRCVKADPGVCQPGYLSKYPPGSNYLVSLREKQQNQKLQVKQNGPRVVCYLTSWALYRKGDGKFVPEHLDNRLCTDVVYAFAGLNPETLTIQPFDPWADIENGLYQRITSVKGSRVLLAIGGWTDSSGDKYSRLISNPSFRRKFIASTIEYLHSHNFDGLSFEWNYPKCWQSDCKKGPDTDKPNFTKLIQELKKAFDNAMPRLTLAVALSGYKEVIDRAYDVHELSEVADFISVMTYDYHGAWESQTGHLAPLYAKPGDTNPYYNVNWTANYLVSLGAERSKLIIGIPFYGQAYRLAQPEHSSLGDPATGPGKPGEFTGQPGMLGYYEICEKIKRKGWKSQSGPSAYFKDQFVGYDNPTSVTEKGEWLLKNGFGGAMAWTVDLDDFMNICCLEPFPLLRSLNRALGRLLDPTPFGENCERPSEPITPEPPTLTTHSDADDGVPRPTRPMTSSTTKATTWPTWTEKPSKKPQSTSTTWPTWTWKPTSTTSTTTTSTTTTTTTIRAPTKWTTTTKKPTTSPEVSSPTTGMSCNFGEYVPDPINCQNFFICVLGQLKKESCPIGLHWDSLRNRCDWPGLAKCQQASAPVIPQKPWSTQIPSSSKRPIRTTTIAPTSFPISPVESPSSKPCHHGEYYAYPESCTHFLICVNENTVIQQCGPGLNWNDEKKMCDWAFMNPCKDKPKQNSPLMMKEMETSKPCIPGSRTGVPGDCESFHACLWGRHEKFSCAPGLHFNKEMQICDWPYRANCDDGSEKVTRPQVSVTTTNRPARPSKRPVTAALTTTITTTTSTTTTTQKPWTQMTTHRPKPLPSGEIDSSKKSPLSGYFKVVCYFTNWAWYRKGTGKYLPEYIDHTLCTHIIYGFAVLDYSELTIRAHDSWADYDNRFYERVVAYKNRGVKVSLAIGGWNDSAGDRYSRLVNSPSSRRKFIKHVIEFIEKYGFEGLDLDWEYPVCWQVDCRKGPASDKEGFAALLRELNAEFKPRGLLLSAAVSPSKTVIDKGYDVPALAKYLDWIAVMTYDYHGQWDKKTGHVAPLYYHEDDEFYFFNANYSINYWISKGAPPRNIVMGMPLYGQAFSIHDPNVGTGLNAPASAGLAGEFTKSAGFLAYYEICDRIKNKGWKVYQDPQRRMGPYAYKGNQWVSFDDADMIRQKAQFIRDMGLGGGMVWALDLDDFRGKCGDGNHPLMHTLQLVLAEPPTQHDRPIKPPKVGQELEWKPHVPPPKSTTSQVDNDVNNRNNDYKVVCYFTNWAWYRQEGGKFLPEDIDSDLCTHVIYGFAVLDGSSLTIKSHDPWADIDNKFYERVVAFKAKGIKVLVGIGGWNDSEGDKYSRLVNSPGARSRFITHVVQFIEKYGFDGLDLDWEYPVCWQVDCNKGPASDKASFVMLVQELSRIFKPKGLLLSSAVSPSKRVIDHGYDVPALAKYLDWISVMTYDFHGQWDKKTGHVAPLYVRPDDWEPTFNANFSIRYWIERGASPKKLVMGAPLYGQSFSLAERSNRGLNAPTYGGGEAGESTRARGFLAYYEICERVLKKGWTVVQDPERRIGPYAYQGDQWVSFDDAKQIKLKAEFIKQLGLGGGMIWALDLDDFENRCHCEPSPLLRTMNRVLRNYPDGPLCSVTGSNNANIEPVQSTTYHPITPSIPQQETTTIPTYLPPDPDDSIEVVAGPAPPTQIPIGECVNQQFMAHNDDCSKYLICNFGQVSEMTCPDGLHWNKDHCDWPENVECKNKKSDRSEETNTIPGAFSELKQFPSPTLASDRVINRSSGKVICYFTNWSWYRTNKGKFKPENIDPHLCTHIIYGFSILDDVKLTMKIQDLLTDIDNDFYGRIATFKSRGIKVLIALGGWYDSASDKYSRLVNNPSARSRFIKHALKFVEKYGFDGIDIDWQYPVCWQVNCERGSPSDKESFALFIKELSYEFKSRGLLLSAAVSASKRVIDKAYNVPVLSRYLDWISVMTYDFHGSWEGKTGHIAPLYYYPGDEYDYFNANFSIRYWIEKGAESSKLVLGIPMYGQSFSLKNEGNTNLQSSALSSGLAGPYTQMPGILAFYEICQKVRNERWSVTKDIEKRIGPYAVHEDQWVSYDDVTNVLEKAMFIRELNLAGGMVWALDLDDFNGNCGCGKYPLLTALNHGLQGSAYGKDCT